MSATIENTEKLRDFTVNKYIENKLDNNSLVQQIILFGDFLNLKTISNYAKENNMTYRGVKNHREIVEIFGNKYVIDND